MSNKSNRKKSEAPKQPSPEEEGFRIPFRTFSPQEVREDIRNRIRLILIDRAEEFAREIGCPVMVFRETLRGVI